MPKPALNRTQARVELVMPPDDKDALQKWCRVNKLTISEVVRQELKPLIDEGYLLP